MVTIIDAPTQDSTQCISELDEDALFKDFLVDDESIFQEFRVSGDQDIDPSDLSRKARMEKSFVATPERIKPIIVTPSDLSCDAVQKIVEPDNPTAIAEFEKAQEVQLQDADSMKPLETIIGRYPSVLCTGCFHAGHNQSEFITCPAARLRSYFSDKSLYDSIPNLTEAIKTVKQDLGYIAQALVWAIRYLNLGYLEQIGIYRTTLNDLHGLLHVWRSIMNQESFIFGRFGEVGKDHMSAEPVDIPMIEPVRTPATATQLGLYEQQFSPPNEISDGDDSIPPDLTRIQDVSGTNPSDMGKKPSDKNKKPFNKSKKRSGAPPSKTFKLPTLGKRLNTICVNCFHRGHAQSSTNHCPFKIVADALDKLKNQQRRRGIEDVSPQVEILQNLVDLLGPGYDGVKNIIDLLEDWHEAVSTYLEGGGKPCKKSGANDAEKSLGVPVGFADHEMADKLTSIIQKDNHDGSLKSPNCPQSLSYTKPTPNSIDDSTVIDSSLGNGDLLPPNISGAHSPIGSEDMNQLYSTFSDLGDIPDFCDQNFGTLSPPKSSSAPEALPIPQEETYRTIYTPRTSQNTSSGTPAVQVLPHATSASIQELRCISQDSELPLDILWRLKCPLKTIGVRKDNLCKSCLHYGHDRSNFSCPAHLVFQSILKRNNSPLSVNSSVEDLKSAIKWQKTLPEKIQGDFQSVQNLVDRWEMAAKNFRENMFEVSVGPPTHKIKRRRHRPSSSEGHPKKKEQHRKEHVTSDYSLMWVDENQQATSPAAMQIAGNDQHINTTIPIQTRYALQHAPPDLPSSPPTQHPLVVNDLVPKSFPIQNRNHHGSLNQNEPTIQHQASPRNIFPQQKEQQQQKLFSAPAAVIAPQGVFFDYHRIPGHLLALLMDYVIEESEPGNEDRLLVDHRRMPKSVNY